jgi:zinc transport system substrate-binding protein
MKKFLIISSTLIGVSLASCGGTTTEEKSLIATLFPQYSLAEQLAGDLLDVEFLLPIGSDPHDFEPTPSQRVRLNNADVVLFTSESFESWVHSLEDTATGKLVDLSTVVRLIEAEEHDDHLMRGPKFVEDHDDDVYDPHYWLDPSNALAMLEAISEEILLLVPEHRLLIESRQVLIEEALEEASELYQDLVHEGEELDVVFAGHNTFGYLTNYDIHVLTPYDGFSTDVDPTALDLIEFSKLIADLDTNILYISSTDNNAVIESLLEDNPTLETEMLYTLENVSLTQLEAETTYQELLMINYESLSHSENHTNHSN